MLGVAAPRQNTTPAGERRYGMTNDQVIANEAAKSRAVSTAQADVVRDTTTLKKESAAGQMIAASQRARELLGMGPTASGAGEIADKAANFFGMSNKGAEVAGKLDIVAGDLVNNVPRMEGPQSDGDRIEYKTQAGRVADRTIPIAQRVAASLEVERLQMKYAKQNSEATTGGATGSFGDKPAPTAKPPAAMKGMVRNGYKFKGGDPSDQSNWERQ